MNLYFVTCLSYSPATDFHEKYLNQKQLSPSNVRVEPNLVVRNPVRCEHAGLAAAFRRERKTQAVWSGKPESRYTEPRIHQRQPLFSAHLISSYLMSFLYLASSLHHGPVRLSAFRERLAHTVTTGVESRRNSDVQSQPRSSPA